MIQSILSVRILTVIQHTCGTVEFKILNAEILQCIEDSLAVVTECYCTVVRIVLLDKNVAVESAISGIANTPIAPNERVATGRTSPWAT